MLVRYGDSQRERGGGAEGGVIFIPFNVFESDLYISVSGDPDGSLGRTLEHNKREVSQHKKQIKNLILKP